MVDNADLMAQSVAQPRPAERPDMLTATLVVVTLIVAGLAAWHVHSITATPGANPGAPAAPGGRHRLGTVAAPYRPWDVLVIPGPGPLTEAEERARMIPAPITEPAWRTADTEVMVIAGHDDTRELAQL
jgi:hypothetical protein